ncbi:hypothetical protein [Klebsiella pneumoniae]|uniref:hypothetical protein n=1 Tax=Klebsiella pneumoniae TaxID=573 RepID=UPI00388FB8D4
MNAVNVDHQIAAGYALNEKLRGGNPVARGMDTREALAYRDAGPHCRSVKQRYGFEKTTKVASRFINR